MIVIVIAVLIVTVMFSTISENSYVYDLCQLLLAVFVHESSHVISAKILGVRYSSPLLTPIGIRIELNGTENSTFKEICVYLAGNVIGFITSFAVDLMKIDSLQYFSYASLTLSGVNLLPLKGLDGGSALALLLNKIFLPHTAEKIIKTVSTTGIILFWFICVAVHMYGDVNITMMLFSIYLIYFNL